MSVWDYAKKAIDPGGLLFNQGVPNQPGVGTPGQGGPPSGFVHDPETGLYYDPTSGMSFTDPQGTHVVADPNLAQQVAANFSRANSIFGNANQVYGQQRDALARLSAAAAGKGPSAATMAGGVAMNQIADDQLSQASGVGGASAPLARLMAARNTAAAQTGVGNQVIMGRVNEQTQARNSLSDLLNAMASQQLTAGTNLASLSDKGQETLQTLQSERDKANAENRQKLLGAGASAGGGIISTAMK